MPLAGFPMFHRHRFALMLTRQWTAPMRHACRPAKARHHRTGQFYPTVRSAVAWSELLTSSGADRLEEDASSCDPDKALQERQDHLPSFHHCKAMARQSERIVCLAVAVNHSLPYDRQMQRVRIR